ncbi:TetR/AcrR family transcriptional regulator [Paenibacillus herberti]|uniref:TetR family transcriptional regulator n=1 Tax=Paenibacillus herberti TaxID=1619309 RepID=A0A229NXD4_9BACL|nr:TetR/AcrR family transcriptional regulator [Paenibacillus herberti]OXM14404.1 TetR family transcriptional regulator [Paenibacillus herberti]
MMETKLSSKDIIIATAARLFATQGYHGTGLNQIIKESGSPKGSLYYYFPNGKEELALECINLIRRDLYSILQELMARMPKPVDFMQAFVLNMADAIDASDTDPFVPFSLWVSAETSAVSDSLRAACQAAFAEWKAMIANKLVETGISRERADTMADLSVCLIEGATIMAIVERHSTAIRRVAEHFPVILQE